MSWELKSLDELGFIGRGKSRHRPRNDQSLYGGIYPFIQTGDIKGADFYVSEYTQTYSQKGLEQSKLWEPNTLCITIAANIADTAILKIQACFPDSVIGFIANENICEVKYVKYFFEVFQKNMQMVSQGATQDNLSLEKLLKFKVPTPPLQTQKRIASILSNYDDLIENNNKRIKLLEETAQNIYKEWFVNLRFPNYENTAFDKESGLPVGWRKGKISEFGQVITGKTPSTKNDSFYNGKIPFVKTPDMHGMPYVVYTNDTLTEAGAESQNNKFLPKNSVMVSCIGTAGVVSLTSESCQTNQQINSVKFEEDYKSFYFFCFAKGLKTLLEGLGSNGATMVNVNKGKFENIEIIMPNNSLLIKFNDVTKVIFEQILLLQTQNQKLKEVRDILLPRLMNRTIEV